MIFFLFKFIIHEWTTANFVLVKGTQPAKKVIVCVISTDGIINTFFGYSKIFNHKKCWITIAKSEFINQRLKLLGLIKLKKIQSSFTILEFSISNRDASIKAKSKCSDQYNVEIKSHLNLRKPCNKIRFQRYCYK